MARHSQRVRNVKPSVLASSVLALVLVAVPAFLIAGARPWATSDVATTAAVPSAVASVTPTTEPTPATASEPTVLPTRKPKAEPTVGSGGKIVRGTTLRLAPPPDDSSQRALQRRTEALLSGETVEEPEPGPAPESEPQPVGVPTTFRVSSFNILGAGHTAAGGKRPEFASGSTRMRWVMSLLQATNVSVAGLQELETPQHAIFRQAAPDWDAFPGMKLTKSALANSIVWRRDVWQFVEGHTIDIPYFHGKPKPMPYLLLRHLETGREVWFANFHNPASVRGPAAHWRREAVSREVALANRLSATGAPVIMTGDMNDRAEFFCPATTRSELHAANGGSTGAPCRPPANMRIDWIMGSADVEFSGYEVRDGALVDRTSDHPFVVASATVAR